MTTKEIIEKFKAGEVLEDCFYSKSNGYSIGGKRITKKQFKDVINSFKNEEFKFELIVGGFTKHRYTYKQL